MAKYIIYDTTIPPPFYTGMPNGDGLQPYWTYDISLAKHLSLIGLLWHRINNPDYYEGGRMRVIKVGSPEHNKLLARQVMERIRG